MALSYLIKSALIPAWLAFRSWLAEFQMQGLLVVLQALEHQAQGFVWLQPLLRAFLRGLVLLHMQRKMCRRDDWQPYLINTIVCIERKCTRRIPQEQAQSVKGQ